MSGFRADSDLDVETARSCASLLTKRLV